MAAAAGISNHLFVVAGLPGETEDDFTDTINFFKQHFDSIDGAEIYAFQLRPGTEYYDFPSNHGLTPVPLQWPWQSRVDYKGTPTMAEAESRAQFLTETLTPLAAATGSNDFLEGHLTLRGKMR